MKLWSRVLPIHPWTFTCTCIDSIYYRHHAISDVDLVGCYPCIQHSQSSCLSAAQFNIQLNLHVLWQTWIKYFDESAKLGHPLVTWRKCDASLGSNVVELNSLQSYFQKM